MATPAAFPWLWVLSLIAIIVLAGTVTGQQTDLSVQLEPDEVKVEAGGSVTVEADVTLRVEEFYCVRNSDLSVYLRGDRTDRFVLHPGGGGTTKELRFQMPAGAAVTATYTESQSTSLELNVARDAEPFKGEASLGADFPGADPEVCGPGPFPQAQDTAVLVLEVAGEEQGHEAESGTSDEEEQVNKGEEQETTGTHDTPLGGWVLPAGGLVSVLWARWTRL